MRPSQAWFPTNRAQQAVWFKNFAAKFTEFGPQLGFSQADVDAVNADNDVFQYTMFSLHSLKATMRSIQAYAYSVTEEKYSRNDLEFPEIDLPPAPPPVSAGIFRRLVQNVNRLRATPDFTESLAVLFGIHIPEKQSENLAEYIPLIKTTAGIDPGRFTVKTRLYPFDAFKVYIQRKDAEKPEVAGYFTNSPAEVKISPSQPGSPEEISVFVQMMKNNEAASQNSAVYRLVVLG